MAKKNCTPCRIPPISTPSPTIKSIIPRYYIKTNRIMKKLALFLLLVAAALSATAQDTIDRPRSNYLHTWPDIDDDKEIQACFDRFVFMHVLETERCGEVGQGYYVESPTAVYGIAAVLKMRASRYDYTEEEIQSRSHHLLDTALSASFEYLRLYEPDSSGRGLNVLAETQVSATDTPVCYFHVAAQNPVYPGEDPHVGPRQVFEVYFDQPVTVTDTFFVGMTKLMGCDTVINGEYWSPSWEIHYVYVASSDLLNMWGCSDVIHGMTFTRPPRASMSDARISEDGRYFLFFPILTPPEGSAAVSAQAPEVLDRYVALQPNPATDRVTVTSSFGLTRIEVHDAAGRKLHDAPASGFSASLDLSRFPSGTLILTVHTPAGPATKKLLKP